MAAGPPTTFTPIPSFRNQSLYHTELHLQHILPSRAQKTECTPGVHTTITHTAESEEKVTTHLQITASQATVIPAPHCTTTTGTSFLSTTPTTPETEALTQTLLSTTQKANKAGTGLTVHVQLRMTHDP